MPYGYDGSSHPSNVIPLSRQDALGAKLATLFPQPNVIMVNDNVFYRFSMSRQPANIPGPFSGIADGGGFFTGIENNSGYSFATSWTHILTAKRANELRLGYNRLHSSRFQFNYKEDVSGSVSFPGVPYAAGTDNGGLPQMTFNDVATLGSPTYLPSNEIQNTYSISDTFTLIVGNQSWKFGAEYRPEEFTIYQPAASRGALSFGTQYTDNPAAQGTGGSGFATLLTGSQRAETSTT